LIEDGGPNDADGAADGTVTDPSGIATRYSGPPSSDSTISISVAEIKAGGSETAVITVVALDSGGRTLEGMTVTAVAGPSGSTISSFSEDGEGVYTATLTPGNSRGNLAITASIFDGTDYAYISTGIVVVKKSGGGGCTVGESQSDLSLILLMLAALMLMARRRLIKTYKNINETE
jgi:adhesin/invasin